MSESASFGGIVSQGVQDVAALLPLLGTEQCKKHLSLSLQKGYLYAAVAPLSIFGSLGIALAGLWIGLACTASGVRRLKDAGFEPASNIAKMIALDDRRYLAETNLIAALDGLEKQGFQNRGGHMKVKFKDPVALWNFRLVLSGLITAGASLIPYFHFIIFHDTSSPLRAWIFPIIRAMGGFFCIFGGQMILQKRIITVIQQRLDFIYIARFLKKKEFNVMAMSIPPSHETHWRTTPENIPIRWDIERTSEECLQDLYLYLELFDWTVDRDGNLKLKELLNHIPDKTTADRLHKKHPTLFPRTSLAVPFPQNCLPGPRFYRVLICMGVLASVVGYVGCFSVVQDRNASARGTYLWIGLESALAIVRMMIWASNPSFDDLHGLQICLDLSMNSPYDLIGGQGRTDSRTLPMASLNLADGEPRVDGTYTILDRESFYDAFIKHSGFLPPLKAKSIVPYYTIFKDRLCIAVEILKPDETKEGVFLLDSRSSDGTPFTLYHAETTPMIMVGAAETPTLEKSAATPAAATTIATVTGKLKVIAEVEPVSEKSITDVGLLQELIMHCDFINIVHHKRPDDLKLIDGHSFDVDWLVNVKHFLSCSKDPNEAWKPVKKHAEELMGNPQDMSKLVYSGSQALYFYHEKLRCYYGDETPDKDLAFHYYNHVKLFFSDYVKRLLKVIKRQTPGELVDDYRDKSKEYIKGVGSVDKLLFSWKSWQWYGRFIPRTGDNQLDVTVRDLAREIWATELYDVIAGEDDRKDFIYKCSMLRLPEDAAPEVGNPSKAGTGPRTTARREGRSFLAKIFCRCTESPEDIEKSEDLGLSGLSDVPRLPY